MRLLYTNETKMPQVANVAALTPPRRRAAPHRPVAMIGGEQVLGVMVAASLAKQATVYGIARLYGFPRLYRTLARLSNARFVTPTQRVALRRSIRESFRLPNAVAQKLRGTRGGPTL